jgi:hypothetical protein
VFYQLYKQEVEARIAKRWQALWMLRVMGAIEAGEKGGGSRKPIQQVLRV